MNDWKLILKVVLGSAVLILIVIFGLSKMSGTNTKLSVDQGRLIDGAKLVNLNGEKKVTVVNFSDMECSACKRAHILMKDLESISGVELVFRHYPLSIHKHALITARAVESARLMGKGWEMVNLLFDKQEEWSGDTKVEDKLIIYAKSLGLDEKVFIENLHSASVSATINQDVVLGDSLQLLGTPTVYVNGEQVAADFVVAKVNELLGVTR